MSSETLEPTHEPGRSDHPASEPDVTRASAPQAGGRTETPAPPGYSGSGDELSASLSSMLIEAHADPLLGEFQPDAPPPEDQPVVAEAAVGSAPGELSMFDVEKTASSLTDQPAGSFDAVAAPIPAPLSPPRPAEAVIEPPPAPPSEQEPLAPQTPGSFDALTALPLRETPPPLVAEPETRSEPTKDAKKADEEEDEEYEDEPRGMSLPFVLLLSYASAVTIGLLWVLWGNRSGKTIEEGEISPPADTRLDPGVRADNSRVVSPPPPIAADHMTTLGQSITMGSLEVTPIAVTVGPVELQRVINPAERQPGGADALKLRLKLRNVSKNAEFDPLDEAFLREREAGVSDSFIETADGQTIAMHPLAVKSEWTIVGQDFKTLKPGESLETTVVSEKDALSRKAPEMTWRVRLRTGKDQTDSVGVRFKEGDVKTGK